MVWEMPLITSRVCGVCPVSHHLAAVKAVDALLGVEIPRCGEDAAGAAAPRRRSRRTTRCTSSSWPAPTSCSATAPRQPRPARRHRGRSRARHAGDRASPSGTARRRDRRRADEPPGHRDPRRHEPRHHADADRAELARACGRDRSRGAIAFGGARLASRPLRLLARAPRLLRRHRCRTGADAAEASSTSTTARFASSAPSGDIAQEFAGHRVRFAHRRADACPTATPTRRTSPRWARSAGAYRVGPLARLNIAETMPGPRSQELLDGLPRHPRHGRSTRCSRTTGRA